MERFVVDTNVLFSFFWKRSWIREIILSPDVVLFLLYNIPMWSNEVRLAKQKVVKVFSNEDIFKRFGFI